MLDVFFSSFSGSRLNKICFVFLKLRDAHCLCHVFIVGPHNIQVNLSFSLINYSPMRESGERYLKMPILLPPSMYGRLMRIIVFCFLARLSILSMSFI